MVSDKYTEQECYSCGITIMVVAHDVSERHYCWTCAYAKLGVTT